MFVNYQSVSEKQILAPEYNKSVKVSVFTEPAAAEKQASSKIRLWKHI